MRTFKLLNLLLLFWLGTSLFGQTMPKEVSRDTANYIKEVEKWLYEFDRGYFKDALKPFSDLWKEGAYTEKQTEIIYDITNFMLKKKVQAKPNFNSFLLSLVAFKNSNLDDKSFENWSESVMKLLDSRSRSKVAKFLDFSKGLFEGNYIYVSGNISWHISTSEFKFEYDGKPKLIVPLCNITLRVLKEKSIIRDTEGWYDIMSDTWHGKYGKYNWERTTLDPTKNYAEFGPYNANLSTPSFKVDTVTYYTQFYDKPMQGTLREKIIASGGGDRYPMFMSFDKRISVKELFPGVQANYDGGFTIYGDQLLGQGDQDNLAKIVFYYKEKPFMEAKSLIFAIGENKISTQKASVKFFLEEDSIYHPGLQFKYLDGRLMLLRNDQGYEKSPYFNSYHKLEMDFEALYWTIGKDIMHFRSIEQGTKTDANFESWDYFTPERYSMLAGLSTVHPLVHILKCQNRLGSKVFNISDLARQMSTNEKIITPIVLRLAILGFLSFDQDSGEIIVGRKVAAYVQNASGVRDYDVISWYSNIDNYKTLREINAELNDDQRSKNKNILEGTGITDADLNDKDNAKLNLLNFDLTLRGVISVTVSRAQKVTIHPKSQTIVMRKNRDFTCAALVEAGRWDFYCNKIDFFYDDFKVDLVDVEKARLNTLSYPREDSDIRSLFRVKNTIWDLQGVLEIDHPKNKSGVKSEDFPGYPKVENRKKSLVYYNDTTIQMGQYDKDKFYFQLEPFKEDSLDDFIPEQFNLPGTLVSAGIFPDLKQDLVIMPDYSLGFSKKVPEGISLYPAAGKAKFVNDIELSWAGLKGIGDIVYQNATASSQDFTFLPDSTHGIGNIVNVEATEPLDQPQVFGQDVHIAYHPGNDYLAASTYKSAIEDIAGEKDPIQMMNGEALLEGTLMIQPSGITGSGHMDMKKADISSKLFSYKHMTIDADTADFNIKGVDFGSQIIKSKNVKAHIDFEKQEGVFESNDENSWIDLVPNQYICFMDKFTWLMETDNVKLDASKKITGGIKIENDLGVNKSNFYSTHPEQDSLNFQAGTAFYSTADQILRCEQIPHIKVADAHIFPDSSKVIIRRKAAMDPLSNAKVLANYVTKFHNIHGGELQISGAKKYTGSGKVTYKDMKGDTFDIQLSEIFVDPSEQTQANGTIDQTDEFKLSPYFDYYGKVNLQANQKELNFSGKSAIINPCIDNDSLLTYFEFTGPITPDKVQIPVNSKELMSGKGLLVGNGIYMRERVGKNYGAFLSLKKDNDDNPTIEAEGFVQFNETQSEYQISNQEKLEDRGAPGNYLSMDIKNCMMFGDGKINYQLKTDQFKIEGVGTITKKINEDQIASRATLLMNMPIPQSVLSKVAKVIKEGAELTPININTTNFEKAVRELSSQEEADRVISEMVTEGEVKKLPEALKANVMLADMKLNWGKLSRYSGYISDKRIGIGSIGKDQFFSYIKGAMFLVKSRNGTNDLIAIYIQLDKSNYLYIEYQGSTGNCNIFSTSPEIMDAISSLKGSEKKVKAAVKGQKKFSIISVSPEASRLYKEMRKHVKS